MKDFPLDETTFSHKKSPAAGLYQGICEAKSTLRNEKIVKKLPAVLYKVVCKAILCAAGEKFGF